MSSDATRASGRGRSSSSRGQEQLEAGVGSEAVRLTDESQEVLARENERKSLSFSISRKFKIERADLKEEMDSVFSSRDVQDNIGVLV